MYINESKRRVHFIDQQKDKYQLPMKEKKLIPENGSLSIQNNQDNLYEKDIRQINPIKEVIRYSFTDQIDKILNMVDQRQNQRQQQIQNMVMQQNKENLVFISQLKEFTDQILLQQQISQEQLKQQQQQFLQKQSKQQRASILLDENNKKRQSQFKEKMTEGQSIKSQEVQNNIRNSIKINNESNTQMIQEVQNKQQDNTLSQGSKHNIQKQQENILNEQIIQQYLENLGIYSHQSNILIRFYKEKVLDFNEEYVDGYYFEVSKQSKVYYKFYIYKIDNIDEIEYNPILISNQIISDNDSKDLESLPHFCSILSFPTQQLFGFFQSFFQYVQADKTQ